MISASAANIPPKAWPLTTAVMYSDGNRPEMPNKPPERIAVATATNNFKCLKCQRNYWHSTGLPFISTTDVSVNMKNSFCHVSVFTSTNAVVTIKNMNTNVSEPTIRYFNGILWPTKAFRIRNSVLGTAADTLKSDVNPAWIGVRSSVEFVVTLRNLYSQYWKTDRQLNLGIVIEGGRAVIWRKWRKWKNCTSSPQPSHCH